MENNPIDKDKITETPSTIAYPHSVGSAVIKPEDEGKIKGKAMAAMVEQTNQQLGQIHEQIQLLAKQAQAIKSRVEVSEKIYHAKMGFDPLIGHQYYLYQRENGQYLLSLLAPEEWGRKKPFEFCPRSKLYLCSFKD